MSYPRSIHPGSTYLITRRTILRHTLLRPDADMNQLITYSLIVAARRHHIQVHALCALSTHTHLVVTDPKGRLPLFLALFHRLIALGTKILRTWDGPVWDHESSSVVALLTPDAIVEKIAYTLANPVAAALVHHAHEWPGAKTHVEDMGRKRLRAKRPDVYFDPTNPEWVSEADLLVSLPPSITRDDAEAFRAKVAAELAKQEAEARKAIPRSAVLGAKRAKTISPHARVTSFEPIRKRNPTFAVGRGNAQAWYAAGRAVRAFRSAYRNALNQWRAGIRDVIFPAGTYWMHAFHRANVALNTV
jgi:putative transposase